MAKFVLFQRINIWNQSFFSALEKEFEKIIIDVKHLYRFLNSIFVHISYLYYSNVFLFVSKADKNKDH